MMRGYAETTDCRRRLLLGYFGEQLRRPVRALRHLRGRHRPRRRSRGGRRRRGRGPRLADPGAARRVGRRRGHVAPSPTASPCCSPSTATRPSRSTPCGRTTSSSLVGQAERRGWPATGAGCACGAASSSWRAGSGGRATVGAGGARRAAGAGRRARRRASGSALTVPADLADADAVRTRPGRSSTVRPDRRLGPVRRSPASGALLDLPLDEVRRVVDATCSGAVHGARAALPHMIAAGNGVLVVVASVHGQVALPFGAPRTWRRRRSGHGRRAAPGAAARRGARRRRDRGAGHLARRPRRHGFLRSEPRTPRGRDRSTVPAPSSGIRGWRRSRAARSTGRRARARARAGGHRVARGRASRPQADGD